MMQDVKQRVALSSIAASAGLTVAKAIVGTTSGSLAILSEAAHSLIDLGATVMTYFAVRVSCKPADAEHHYGHGKVESVTALAETALLFGLAGVVIWEAAKRLMSADPPQVEATRWAFAVMLLSIIVDFFRARVLYRTAAQTSSEALEADALHFYSDMWSSLAVVVGLLGITLGYAWADSVAAIVVSIVICIAGWRLGRRTVDTLTDTAPAGVASRVAAAVSRIPGVVEVERLRARQVGEVLFVDLLVAVSRTLPLDRVAALKNRIVETGRLRCTTSRCIRSKGGLPSPSISKSTVRFRWAPRTILQAGSKTRYARNSGRMWKSTLTSSLCNPMMSPGVRRRPNG